MDRRKLVFCKTPRIEIFIIPFPFSSHISIEYVNNIFKASTLSTLYISQLFTSVHEACDLICATVTFLLSDLWVHRLRPTQQRKWVRVPFTIFLCPLSSETRGKLLEGSWMNSLVCSGDVSPSNFAEKLNLFVLWSEFRWDNWFWGFSRTEVSCAFAIGYKASVGRGDGGGTVTESSGSLVRGGALLGGLERV